MCRGYSDRLVKYVSEGGDKIMEWSNITLLIGVVGLVLSFFMLVYVCYTMLHIISKKIDTLNVQSRDYYDLLRKCWKD